MPYEYFYSRKMIQLCLYYNNSNKLKKEESCIFVNLLLYEIIDEYI